jgi:uncharacterized protein (UPF0335 family)
MVGDNAKAALRSFVERVENLNEEIDALTADRKEVFDEAKVSGFDPKTLRKVIALRRNPPDAQAQALVDLYVAALEGE